MDARKRHILLSKRVADDLAQYPRWRSFLHDLGECEVKHGVRIDVVNFYGDGIGIRKCQSGSKFFRSIVRRFAVGLIAAVVVAAALLAFQFARTPKTGDCRASRTNRANRGAG